MGKPLFLYIADSDRRNFYLNLSQLSQSNPVQVWSMNLRPRNGKPFAAELHVDVARHPSGTIESVRIAVYTPQPSQQLATAGDSPNENAPALALPRSLDGLQVLVVDDEADARDFITTVLESHGIRVRAVDSAAAALEELERFHPDVVISDIRMPREDGYSLIQQIRALESKQGRHLPAAALTAYLDEDREKALTAGFEAHLHKLAQPTEMVELVVHLAE